VFGSRSFCFTGSNDQDLSPEGDQQSQIIWRVKACGAVSTTKHEALVTVVGRRLLQFDYTQLL